MQLWLQSVHGADFPLKVLIDLDSDHDFSYTVSLDFKESERAYRDYQSECTEYHDSRVKLVQ
jgi:hypothetical protein